MTPEQTDICRYCGKILIGKPYRFGGSYAYDPKTKEAAKTNYYGGYVCSRSCDFNASLTLERSMPGHGYSQKTLLPEVHKHWVSNWRLSS